MENEKVQLTREGYDKLKAELRNLIDVIRPEVIEQLAYARSLGDLSENADYDAAKARQADVEQRIRQLEDILSNASIVDDASGSTKIVSFGRTVKILNLSNKKEYTFKIVGTHETRFFYVQNYVWCVVLYDCYLSRVSKFGSQYCSELNH